MKKTFSLTSPKHKPPQVIAAIKNELRKYLKRERRKALPEGVDFWDFDCKVGHDGEPPLAKHVEELIPAIDEAANKPCEAVYIEIHSKPGHRKAKEMP